MSLMERFDIRKDSTTDVGWRLTKREDGRGMVVYAEEALQYRGSFYQAVLFNIVLATICSVLAGYAVFHQHDPATVQKVSEEEHRAVVQQEQQAQAEKAVLRKQLADEHARRLLADKMIKESNANNAKLVRQLKEVQASVPPLPVIESSLRKEAATDAGFMQAVRRNFGPIKVEVR